MQNCQYEEVGNCGKCTRLEREWEFEEREDLLSEIFSQSRIGTGGENRTRLKVRKYQKHKSCPIKKIIAKSENSLEKYTFDKKNILEIKV